MKKHRKKGSVVKRFVAFAVAGAALFGAAGCSSAEGSPGTALVVDGRVVTEDQLTVATDQLSTIWGASQPRFAVAWELATAYAFLDEMEQLGEPIATEDLDAASEGYLVNRGSPLEFEELSPTLKPVLYMENYLDTLLADPQWGALISKDEVKEGTIMQADVVMNPRYDIGQPLN